MNANAAPFTPQAPSVEQVANQVLPDFDPDLLGYIVAVLEEMTLDERQNLDVMAEAVAPFITDSEYVNSEIEAEKLCKQMIVAFGGSGFKSGKAVVDGDEEDSTPELLTAPVRIKEMGSHLLEDKKTYGGVVFADTGREVGSSDSNTALDMSSMPTTTRQRKRAKKEQELLQRKLRAVAAKDAEERRLMAAARMAAIRANRVSGNKAKSGYSLDRFSLPHPSGTGNLLDDVSLSLASQRRYGLIGKNGSGKTTLMKALANYALPGLSHLKILLVDQHVEGDTDTPLQWLLRADVERTALLADEARINAVMYAREAARSGNATAKDLPADMEGVNLEAALEECYERMGVIGVATAEQRALQILRGLGFTDAMAQQPTSSLSGGWTMRAALASALFLKPDLLLLDEPTNHLDVHALVWLEQWLLHHFDGIALIVSHDHFFLDAVCTDILELKSTLGGHSRSSLEHFSGDYATYVATVEEHKIGQARLKKAQDLKKEKLQEFVSREGKKFDHHTHQMQRKSKLKKLNALKEEQIEDVEEDCELRLLLPAPNGVFSDKETLLSADAVSCQLPDEAGGALLFSGVDFVLTPRHRLGIIGKNGCGKTCLLNMLIGDMPPSSGEVRRHLGARMTMLQQHHYKGEQLDPDLNAIEHIRLLPQDEGSAVGVQNIGSRQEDTAYRGYLANCGISGTTALVAVKYLSGGQRMRVALAVAMYSRPDVLILDEPTNHLDAESVAALGEALEKFEGAIIVVSHDEAFVNKLLTGTINGVGSRDPSVSALQGELWVLERQQFRRFEGNFRKYKKKVLQTIKKELKF